MGLSRLKVDFIGLGEMKSGTSWIANALSQHPGVSLSFPKELHYFNEKSAYYNPQKEKYHTDLKGYASHFSHSGRDQIKGEFSVHYLFDPRAAERIKRHFPECKLIICTRDPVERAFSQWVWSVYHKHQEKRSFEAVMEEETELVERGLYYKNLAVYLDHFPSDQILILSLDAIKKEPLETLSKIARFLAIDSFPEHLNLNKSNSAKSTKSQLLYKMERFVGDNLHKIGLSGLGNTVRKSGLGKRLNKFNSKKSDLPVFRSEYHSKYDAIFEEDQRKLKDYLQRQLG